MLRHCNATAKDLESVAEPEPVGAGLFLVKPSRSLKLKAAPAPLKKCLKNRTLCFSTIANKTLI